MLCPKCKKEVEDTWKVCPFCMQPLEASLKCQKCGAELKPGWRACPECATVVETADRLPTGGPTVIPAEGPPQVGSRKTIEAKGATFDFCWIPPGQFQMGSTVNPNEQPVHKVEITRGFWLGRTQVTQGQWRAMMGTNPSYFPEGDDYPVEQVSWNDCLEFIEKLNRLTGGNFRLPTEAEWEYACRAGISGEQSVNLSSVAWFGDNSNKCTHPVAQKRPNSWGLYDMLGNVWEWCQDWYDEHYYASSPAKNPTGPATGSYRVDRGGGWCYGAGALRCAFRGCNGPAARDGTFGFRLASGSAGG